MGAGKRTDPKIQKLIKKLADSGLTNAEIIKKVQEETGEIISKRNVSTYSGRPQKKSSIEEVKEFLANHGKSTEGTDDQLRKRKQNLVTKLNRESAAKSGDFSAVRRETRIFLSDIARKAKDPERVEMASKFLELLDSDENFPTQKQLKEIQELKAGKGVYERSRAAHPNPNKIRTLSPTDKSGPKSKELRIFDSNVSNVESRINTDLRGLIDPEIIDKIRVARSHGLPKSTFPHLRLLESNVFLNNYDDNARSGAQATAKDLYESARRNVRMPGVGISKEGIKSLYAINDMLVKQGLEPLGNLDYFKNLPRTRSYTNTGNNIVDRIGVPRGDVPGVIKKSLMNLMDSPLGKVLKVGGKAIPLAGYGIAADASVDYAKSGNPILSAISGASAIPVLGDIFGIPLAAAEGIGLLYNRDKKLQEERDRQRGLIGYTPPRRFRGAPIN